MKIVMIPDTHTLWECTINKKHYAYPGGTEQTVPDEVAALIADITRAFPDPTPETVKVLFDQPGGSGSSPVPAPEAADIGKVLGIVEDGAGAKYAPVEGSGSGLPDPSELADGTAAVVVNGEWKMQEGYGYTGDPAFEPITWDGDKEGREAIELGGSPALWKVSDAVLTGEMFSGAKARDNIGAVSDVVVLLSADGFVYAEAELIGRYIISGVQGEYSVGGDTVAVPSDGTYFMELGNDYVAELTAPPSVHKFDSALIPSSGVDEFVVKFEMADDGIISDKTIDDIFSAVSSGKLVKGILYDDNGIPFLELPFNAETGYFVNLSLVAPNTLRVTSIEYDNISVWTFNRTNYTIAPATPSEDGTYVLTCTITDGEAVYSWETNA